MTRPLPQNPAPAALTAKVYETEHTDLLGLYERVSRRASCVYRRAPDGSELLGIGIGLAVEADDESLSKLYGKLREQLAEASGDLSRVSILGWTAFDTFGGVAPGPRRSASDHGRASFGGGASSPGSKADIPGWGAFARRQLFVPQVLLRRHDSHAEAVVLAEDGQNDELWSYWQEQLDAAIELKAPAPSEPHVDWLDEEAFRRGVRLVTDERVAPKVVVARRAHVRAPAPIAPSAVLRNLADTYPSCSTFAISPAASSAYPVFAGATPETLARVRDGEVETMALAGTSRNDAGEAPDLAAEQALLSSQKDLDEHRFVLDMILEALTPLCTVVAAEPEPRPHRLANVSHLMTRISGTLEHSTGLAEVVDALHPTPAVCGTPRELAMRLIGDIEGFDRGLYAGAFGSMDLEGNGEFDVALRCGLIDEASALLFAGAGITAGSDVDLELSETQSKFAPMLDAIAEVDR